ncbi:uroporphyrinogen-III C-methyltransferase [Kamptonema animale CS-326]|jgi:uroporphyrinogen III methyltransferase/synthase|uniref:uroporphyrinogen-III C-methyltransferase n=1 Tax=Kamptonema animale TaxID=92934 RepID=UPI00232C5218|nr:uroporphyrinogen-III C-methyltransferase [Kamptonema animale]MDB9510559.1 uroporphyrinogen-III C-methyltransferase [Kamptonema animale CS-326]
MKETRGKVYLVGAGPGDCSLMTVRSHELLAQAEVLIYDALVDVPQLELISADCLKLEVGKRGGKPSVPQQEINRLLVKHCQAGKLVVRLKSGDPFIFGRSTSEIQALRDAECDFEVVAGISSALAAPLLAGIPLTDPVMSRCFAVMSAHDTDALDWEALVQIETLVILMGGSNLKEILRQLQRHGRSHQTPTAIIRDCGRADKQVWIGTIADIAQKTAGQSLSPCVIVIGEVVRLREYLMQKEEVINCQDSQVKIPSSAKPLAGKTILVTRSMGHNSEFSDRLQLEGAQVIEMPALAIGPPASWEALDSAIAQLSTFNWLILTSTNGTDYFFQRLAASDKDARALSGVKIAVVGKKTADSLRSHSLIPDFIPPDFIADSLAANFPDNLDGCKILFPRVESGGREALVKELTAKGARVTEVPAYQSCCPETIPPAALAALQNRSVNIITFASSKTVQNFCHLIETYPELSLPSDWENRVCIASIGPETSKTCKNLFGWLDVEAKEYTLDGLRTAIVEWTIANSGSMNPATGEQNRH